ncbi:MAG: glycosyltransferase family 39 protein [Candidatus Aenigmatarchaeota archaeon]
MVALKNLWKEPMFRKLIIAFIIIKLFIIALGLVGDFSFPLDNVHQRNVTGNPILNEWAQYDGAGYLDLAQNGYNKEWNNTGNYSVYPLFSMLIAVFAVIFGYPLAAFLISNIFSLVAIILLYILVRKELDEKKSYRAALFLMLFPTVYFFTAMYAESLFLALVLAMFICARKNQWLIVGLLGFAVSLTRIQGILVFLPMLYMYVRQQKIKMNMLYLFLIPAGLACLFLYQGFVTGDSLIQFHYGFGLYEKGLSWPWDPVIETLQNMITTTKIDWLFYNGANFVMLLFMLGLTWHSYKNLKKEYFIYSALSILFVLISSNLHGIGRYPLAMFPLFMSLAMLYEKNDFNKWFVRILYVVFVALLVVFVFRHVNQGIYLSLSFMF